MDSLPNSLSAQRAALDKRMISARELTEAYLSEISRLDGEIRAYLTVDEEGALARADAAQAAIDRGEALPLTGIPYAVKDNICTEGIRTTCGSKMLADFVPPYSASAVERLNARNAVMLGKTNLDEFAMGSTNQTSAFGGTRNPRDTDHVPGGSSGGSAAAVAAGMCTFALGSDTGGSVRQPASFCGVAGIKPTYGRVSRFGLVAFASSLDQIGVLAKDAYSCAAVLGCISGYDTRDCTSSAEPVPDFAEDIGKPINGMKLAVPEEYFGDGTDDEVRRIVLAAAERFRELGAEIVNCSMPSLKYAVPVYYLISSAEAASNLARFDGIKYGHRASGAESFEQLISRSRSEGFGDEVKRRILLGNYALSSGFYDDYYVRAMALRQTIRADHDRIFSDCAAILTPTSPTAAYRIGEDISRVSMYCADICTAPANLAGLPAVSVPCGKNAAGLPVGLQLIGRRFDERTILRLADAFERIVRVEV